VELYFTFSFQEDDELILAKQTVEGDRQYNYELSAWHRKGDHQWYFNVRSVPTCEEYEERAMYFPFSALPWLRQQIVEILVEHDGTEPIDEMPTIPEWTTRGFLKFLKQKGSSRPFQIPLSKNEIPSL
jgi:hypothetical protein